MAFAGWLGLFITALNLLPVGQLDGGHVTYALFGRWHRTISRLFVLGCILMVAIPFALGTSYWAGWLFWAVLLFALGLGHPVTADADTPLDPMRRFAAWATIALFIVTFCPVPLSFSSPTEPQPEDKTYDVMHVAPAHPAAPDAHAAQRNLIGQRNDCRRRWTVAQRPDGGDGTRSRTRPSWDQYFMTITQQVAERSTCLRAKVGAVIVRDRSILATGYNGAPAGLPHCLDVGCLIYESKNPDGEIEENCFRTIHAEINAITQAARNGVPIRDADIYVTHTPCIHCMKVLINTGIKTVFYGQPYKLAGISGLLSHARIKLIEVAAAQ